MGFPMSIIKAVGKNKMLLGSSVFFGAGDYEAARENGHSIPGAVLAATASTVIGMTPWGGAAQIAGGLIEGGYSFMQGQMSEMRQQSANGQIPFKNSYFQDSQQFATMRQAGMAIAKKSEYTLQQSMMGNEARYIHRE